MRIYKLEVEVRVPDDVTSSQVEEELNQALNEPPCDWGNWSVGTIIVVSRRIEEGEVKAQQSHEYEVCPDCEVNLLLDTETGNYYCPACGLEWSSDGERA